MLTIDFIESFGWKLLEDFEVKYLNFFGRKCSGYVGMSLVFYRNVEIGVNTGSNWYIFVNKYVKDKITFHYQTYSSYNEHEGYMVFNVKTKEDFEKLLLMINF